MKYYADLHLHSHFSRATSKNLNLEHLSQWAQLKGIRLVGTGDFVHPGWLSELKEKLEPAEEGFFKLRSEFARLTQQEVPGACTAPVRFLLSAEISNIYKRMDKVRKVHNVIFAPNFEAAEKIQSKLETIGNIRSDGRPILGLDSRDLLEIVLEADPTAFLIPAHIWTPWFSALGSKGGFDRIEDCFADLTSHIFAVETGLSSDPPMNWRLKQLEPYILVSNSDAHSPQKLAREATIFDTGFSYPALYRALADPDDAGAVGTIEFFPQEGKYHFDGHRKCGTRMHPRETRANNGLCPRCGKPVTVGVMARVEELADRPAGEKPPRWRPYFSLVPLPEVIGEAKQVGAKSKAVGRTLQKLLAKLGNELIILQDAPLEDIRKIAGSVIAEGVRRMREGEVHIAAGYDGEYGVIRLFAPGEREKINRQTTFLPEQKESVQEKQEPILSKKFSAIQDQSASYQTLKSPSSADMQLGMQLPEDLNAAQWRAVTHTGSHLLIVAGPGTGKTHTLTYRIAHVAQCFAAAQDILAITFTNKAAEEMQERLNKRLGEEANRVTVGTFHSFCLQLLRKYLHLTQLPAKFSIATPDDVTIFCQQLWPEKTITERRELLAEISRWKASGKSQEPPDLVMVYNQKLRENGRLDFDDLLIEALNLLRTHAGARAQTQMGIRFIFVDEYQDINAAQHALLQELVQNGVLLTAIGDPNQAIYGFRGADIEFFSRFEQDFPGAKILHLSENYRSASNLLTASGQVIRKTELPGIPPLTARLYAEGRLIIYEAPTEKAEAEYVVHQIEKMVGGTSMFSQDSGRVASEAEADYSFADIAVLYRLNRQRPLLEEALSRSGIPFQVSGDKPLIAWPAVSEMITALQLANEQPISPESACRVLVLAASGIGSKSAETLLDRWKSRKKQILPDDIKALAKETNLLSSKGQEGIVQFVHELSEIREKLHQSGLIAALQHFILLPQWRSVLTTEEKRNESWQRLIRLARLHNGLREFLDYLFLQRNDDVIDESAEKVSLLTLHAAKGLEFPVVFIVGCEEGLLPLKWDGRSVDLDEERRLFYVGMTRAREHLCLVRSKKRSLFGKTQKTRPSPFLADIEEQLKLYEKTVQKPGPRRALKQANQLELFE